MSHKSTSNADSSGFHPYSDKDMILSEDEEESATLAEPMTLEGAKQLAQSSGRVDNPAPKPPTLTPPLSLPVQSPSHPCLASPSPSSLHHLSSPPLTTAHPCHDSHNSIHSLSSPPTRTGNSSSLHSQIASPPHPLNSPSHPHLPSLHRDHPLWVSPPVSQEDADRPEEDELPSTVDIQAIRDSPSPDPASDKLVTINENWAMPEEQSVEQDALEYEEDEESDDDESTSSETDSSVSDNANSKDYPKRSLANLNLFETLEPCQSDYSESKSTHTAIHSEQSCCSLSDTDSRDSDTSDHSSSGGSATSSDENNGEGEEEDTSMSKPLPRMKPQLTASNSQVSKKFSNLNQRGENSSILAKGKLINDKVEYNNKRNNISKDALPISTEDAHSFSRKDSLNKYSKTEDLNSSKLAPSSTFHGSRNLKFDEEKYFSDYQRSICNQSAHNSSISVQDVQPAKQVFQDTSEDLLLFNSKEKTGKEGSIIKPEGQSVEEHLNSALNNLNIEKDRIPRLNELKVDVDAESSEDLERSSEKKLSSQTKVEERRLEKERQMDQEFDRLLKSSEPKPRIHKSKNKCRGDNITFTNSPKSSCINNASILKKGKLCFSGQQNDAKNKVVPIESSMNDIENKKCFDARNLNTFHKSIDREEHSCSFQSSKPKCEMKDSLTSAKTPIRCDPKGSSSPKRDGSPSPKGQVANSHKCDVKKRTEVPNHKFFYSSSDSKSNYPSCSSSGTSSTTSSSDSEDTSFVKMQTPKRTPSLNVTAKYVSRLDKKTRSAQKLLNPKRKSDISRELPESPNKLNSRPNPDKGSNNIHPTIADLVKVRERRGSLDKESLSGSEKESDRKSLSLSPLSRTFKEPYEEETAASSSETSDELNEKVDLDTELTQTFSVSDNHFNQGRLTLKIAAMKMAKFGKTGLREVAYCGLPTRSDLHSSPNVDISIAFKKPRTGNHQDRRGNGAAGLSSIAISRPEPHKVKTAAERKTYADALPPCGTYCSLKSNKRKKVLSGRESNMRVPTTSLRPSGVGLCTAAQNSGFSLSGSVNLHHHYHHIQYDEEEEQISRLAHHLSQISHDHIGGDGLQVLDQEDLEAILPDVTNAETPETPSPTVPMDPFPDVNLGHKKSESESHSDEEDQKQVGDLYVRDTISSFSLLANSSMAKGHNSFGETLNDCTSRTKQTKKCELIRQAEENLEKKRTKVKSQNQKDISLDEDPDTPSMPELETYGGLDCNGSNVSPDSGIQSVNGSPLHQVGSPHHQSLYYSSSVLSVGNGNRLPSNNNESMQGRNSAEQANNGRSFSPILSLQDSPPPPTLLPAITPPHMASSPQYSYEDSPNSPPMPSLKCQVDPPPWEGKNSNSTQSSLEEQGSLNEKGPGRPPGENSEQIQDQQKPKRPRGRPKGSKNKKKLKTNTFFEVEAKSPKSFIKEPNNALAKLDKLNEYGHYGSSGLDYSSMKHKWRGTNADLDDLPHPTEAAPVRRRKPGRPRRLPNLEPELGGSLMMAYGLNTLDKKPAKNSISESIELKAKRPVGRPRKYHKVPNVDSKQPHTLASKKCFSEKIMHKIINENVRNSEKSDKLSVQHVNDQDLTENGRSSEKSDKLTHYSTSADTLTSEKMLNKTCLSYKEIIPSMGDQSDPYAFQDSTTSGVEDFRNELHSSKEKKRRRRRMKPNGDGIPLDEKRRKRGRKKELPAIFEKVYGSVKNINLKNEPNKILLNSPSLSKLRKKKKRHKKAFKSKHKNIVDPVFLTQLEDLISQVQNISISKSLLTPQPKPGEVLLPAMFRIHKVVFSSKKRRGNEKPKSDKESGTEGEGAKEKLPSKRKKKLQEIPKQGKERCEANEQRLPLKKRHRHISTAVPPTSPDPPTTKVDTSKSEHAANIKVMNEKDKEAKDKLCTKFSENSKTKNEAKTCKSQFENAIVETSFLEQEEHRVNPSRGINLEESPLKIDKDEFGMEQSGVSKKQDPPLPTTVTTTPKKRRRLEADLAGTTVIAPTVTTLASLTATVTTNVISSVSSTLIPNSVPAIRVKQEKDLKFIDKESSNRKLEKESKLSEIDVTKKQEKYPKNSENETLYRKERDIKITECEYNEKQDKILQPPMEGSPIDKIQKSQRLHKIRKYTSTENEISSKKQEKITKPTELVNKKKEKPSKSLEKQTATKKQENIENPQVKTLPCGNLAGESKFDKLTYKTEFTQQSSNEQGSVEEASELGRRKQEVEADKIARKDISPMNRVRERNVSKEKLEIISNLEKKEDCLHQGNKNLSNNELNVNVPEKESSSKKNVKINKSIEKNSPNDIREEINKIVDKNIISKKHEKRTTPRISAKKRENDSNHSENDTQRKEPKSLARECADVKDIEKEATSKPPKLTDSSVEKCEALHKGIKNTELKACDVVIEKCDNLGLTESKNSLSCRSAPVDKMCASPKSLEKEGTHSDSDIPSEHEPLCESDQSGFMSDKEGPNEVLKKVTHKRRKKKRDLRSPTFVSPIKIISENLTIKKRIKRRKTNKTGFPTVRKKRRKVDSVNKNPKDLSEDTPIASLYNGESPDKIKVENNGSSQNLELRSLTETNLDYNSTNPEVAVNESRTEVTKPRGRPKKIKPQGIGSTEGPKPDRIIPRVSKDLREILRERKPNKPDKLVQENKNSTQDSECSRLKKILEKVADGSRSHRKRDSSRESSKLIMDRRKSRKIGEDESIEDSDTNLISSEYQISSESVSSDESSKYVKGKKKVPRWKKRYLVAGLLSDYYKQDEPLRKNGEITLTRCRFNYEPENHIHGLLPAPSYCKKWLRERQVDFLLPYDLWWLHSHNMLPGRDLVPSWNFKRVKSNIYYDVRPPNHDSEIQACNCRRPKPSEKGCLEDCINRMMFIECSAQTCPIKESCSNQRIQRHETLPNIQRFMTADKGWGIKAKCEINQGTFIMEYVGEVVSEKEFKYRMQTKYSSDTHHYCLNLDRGMVIDGHRMGGDCRFVNHSCNPNCEMQKWHVNGQYRMGLFSLEDIDCDEELSYDYNFSLFNPSEGQSCKCGAENCRGVIGGRSQRLNGQQSFEEKKKMVGRNKKDACKKRKRGTSTDTEGSCVSKSQYPVKPLSHQQKLFILAHRCFLLRNLERIKCNRDRQSRIAEKRLEEIPETIDDEPCNKIQKFLTHFTALNTARSVKTRRLAQAEDDPEMTRVAKLAQIFKDIYDKLVASRDEKEKPLATPFMTLPSKKKYPNYYTRIGEPIDLTIIEKNILTGYYSTAEIFDRDIMRLFANNLRYFGRNTQIGQMAVGLRKVYSECKLQFKPLLEEVLGEDQLPLAFANCSPNEEFEDEDVIRCVCNLHRDEGMMIQCEQCLVWQHCDCMGVADDSPDHYLCEECSPRLVSPEVPMTPQPSDSPKDKYFITLLRDTLQIKLGDSVYILRDRPAQKSGERRQPAYKIAKDVKQHELLIFKVENLWIDQKGDKFAFGHHYLMPHETFHEPWRKFFQNEVIRSPICDIIPLDMIVNHCWVMDHNSYCRGRPIGAVEEHTFVCEYRVDKTARVFSKISKPKYPICTKPYAFVTFSHRLRPQRTYTPHEVISNGRSRATMKEMAPVSAPPPAKTENAANEVTVCSSPSVTTTGENDSNSAPNSRASSGNRKSRSCSSNKNSEADVQETQTSSPLVPEGAAPLPAASSKPPQPSLTERSKKRLRINHVATKLLKQLPAKGVVDLAYLLETGKRLRKKTSAFSS